jgi:hypothetical protein
MDAAGVGRQIGVQICRDGPKSRPGIPRFSDVQSHIIVRCFASPRNDGLNGDHFAYSAPANSALVS